MMEQSVQKKKLRVVIGADHRGFAMKEYIKLHLNSDFDISWIDVGAYNTERSDYPLFAAAACKVMLEGKADYGILLCGSGAGMAVAANRFAKIYAGLAWNEQIARAIKEDDNINVLVLPSDFITDSESITIVTSWLTAEFKNGRYQHRIDMIDLLKK